MSTKSPSLPVYAPLALQLMMAGLQAVRRPRPLYRALFRINICNTGPQAVRLLGRKWTLRDLHGNTRIIEASKVFDDYPTLTPGAVFSCSGCHEFDSPPLAMELRLFGNDELGAPFISDPLRFPASCFRR